MVFAQFTKKRKLNIKCKKTRMKDFKVKIESKVNLLKKQHNKFLHKFFCFNKELFLQIVVSSIIVVNALKTIMFNRYNVK